MFYFHELGNAWQVGTNPTITYDTQASSGDKWNVPLGITVAKTMKLGKRIVKFQLGVEHSVSIKPTRFRSSRLHFVGSRISSISPGHRSVLFNSAITLMNETESA